MTSKLLGHTQVQTIALYAHLAADPVKAAAEHVSSNIAALINGETVANPSADGLVTNLRTGCIEA